MNKTKTIILFLILIIVVSSAAINVSRQLSALVEARKMNNNLAMKVDKLTESNKDLNNKIIYATSSAYLENRKNLWKVKNPPAETDYLKPKYQQWFDLFTN
ncbi:MAG: hypothetical protein WCG91_01495 [Candidatus Shapirobacteria bacterium]